MRIERKSIKEEKGEVLVIEEEVKIPGTNIILEKGDRIEVFEAKKKSEEDEEGMEGEDETEPEDEVEVEEKKTKGKK